MARSENSCQKDFATFEKHQSYLRDFQVAGTYAGVRERREHREPFANVLIEGNRDYRLRPEAKLEARCNECPWAYFSYSRDELDRIFEYHYSEVNDAVDPLEKFESARN